LTEVKMPRAVTSRSIFEKPEFDLIGPGRIRRRVVEMDGRMRDQEGPDLPCFVGREIVQDDVHLAPARLRLDDRLEKADECRAGVTRGGATADFARPRIERRIERQRPVPVET
jgi:hypothetical protein